MAEDKKAGAARQQAFIYRCARRGLGHKQTKCCEREGDGREVAGTATVRTREVHVLSRQLRLEAPMFELNEPNACESSRVAYLTQRLTLSVPVR